MSPLPVVVLGRLSSARAQRLLAAGRSAEPTYAPVGATLAGKPIGPGGFERERVVGAGPADFAAAVACFRALEPQRSVATVVPGEATAELGATVLIVLGFGPLTLVAVDRVVAVVDEPRRWGFAYGTLPGHPEVGEEAFLVEHRPDDAVVARIVARAHAAIPAGRLLGRLTVPVQTHFAERYLDAVEAAVAAAANR